MIEIFARSQNKNVRSNYFLSKIETPDKQIFFIKYINFWSKNEINLKRKFWSNTEILVKHRNLGQKKTKFWSKIEILTKNRNFDQKSKF